MDRVSGKAKKNNKTITSVLTFHVKQISVFFETHSKIFLLFDDTFFE